MEKQHVITIWFEIKTDTNLYETQKPKRLVISLVHPLQHTEDLTKNFTGHSKHNILTTSKVLFVWSLWDILDMWWFGSYLHFFLKTDIFCYANIEF